MKKLIPVLLSLLMALAMTATALAATVYTEGALHYTIADESITITGYFGKDAAVTVPASIAGIPVNTIAKGAFTGNDNVKTVDLPGHHHRRGGGGLRLRHHGELQQQRQRRQHAGRQQAR